MVISRSHLTQETQDGIEYGVQRLNGIDGLPIVYMG